MNNSNSSSDTKSSRVTLKLKAGARKPSLENKTPSVAQPTLPQPQRAGKPKTGAHWSDEYKERMQAEMDALNTR